MNYRFPDDGQHPVIGDTEPAAPRTAARLSDTAESEPTPTQQLAAYGQRIRRRWLLVALLALIGGLLAFIHSSSQPKEYRATSTLLFPQLQPASTALGGSAPQPADPERASNTNVKLVTLRPVADQVRAALGNRQSDAELLRRVAVSVDNNSDLVALTVREPTPRLAAAAANAFAEGYVAFRRRLADADISRMIRVTTRQLDSLSPLERGTTQGRELRSRLAQLQVAGVAQSNAVHLVQRASVPSAPASPHPARSAILGLFLGLLLGIAVALIVDALDPRLKANKDIEGAFGLPVVDVLPADGHATGKLRVPTAGDRAAYQRIAARLRLWGLDGGVLVVGGTGGASGQGAVSLGIAQALALDGQRVALIDLDASDSAIPSAPRLGTQSLDAVLANPTSLEHAWTELDACDLTPARGEWNGTVIFGAGIFVVAPPAPESPSLAAALHALVLIATGLVDTVIVSLASLDDGVSITVTADRALLVARRNETTKGSAATARRTLLATGVFGVGVVVTASSSRHRLGGLSIPASWRPGFLRPRPESGA